MLDLPKGASERLKDVVLACPGKNQEHDTKNQKRDLERCADMRELHELAEQRAGVKTMYMTMARASTMVVIKGSNKKNQLAKVHPGKEETRVCRGRSSVYFDDKL